MMVSSVFIDELKFRHIHRHFALFFVSADSGCEKYDENN
jgi:hypothetical protein